MEIVDVFCCVFLSFMGGFRLYWNIAPSFFTSIGMKFVSFLYKKWTFIWYHWILQFSFALYYNLARFSVHLSYRIGIKGYTIDSVIIFGICFFIGCWIAVYNKAQCRWPFRLSWILLPVYFRRCARHTGIHVSRVRDVWVKCPVSSSGPHVDRCTAPSMCLDVLHRLKFVGMMAIFYWLWKSR